MKRNNSIYIVSFFEGAAVMATELCGSKLISPYFGSSLYVWAAVIAVTLGSLAAGYFYGGKLSLKEDPVKALGGILLISAVYMGLMPLVTNLFGVIAVHFPFSLAVISSGSILLFLPMFMMGAASPLVISIQAKITNEPGRISGLVYSISTIGGILSTFLSGFWFIPEFGINVTLILFAVFLTLSLLLLLQKKSSYKIITALMILIIMGFTNSAPSGNCIFQKDGILGKVVVIDDTLQNNSIIRSLMVNNIIQSTIDARDPKGFYVSEYIKLLDSNFTYVNGGKALILGLGGGITANLFIKKNYEVTGVEFDPTILEVADKFFFMDKRVKTFCDDARYFINQCNEKYDIVLMDLFKAEEQPSHVITKESFEKMKTILNTNGKLVINWHGYSKGERGMGTAILLNTLKKAGYNFRLAAFKPDEDYRNLVIIAGIGEPASLKYEIKNDTDPTDIVNTDLHPVMEKYNATANQTWRRNYILYYYSTN